MILAHKNSKKLKIEKKKMDMGNLFFFINGIFFKKN